MCERGMRTCNEEVPEHSRPSLSRGDRTLWIGDRESRLATEIQVSLSRVRNASFS